MTVTLGIPALICVVGLVVYALANGKAAELGRVAFAAGLLALLFVGLR